MRAPSREIRIPFQIGSEGGIASTDDRVRQAMQHILSVVMTNPGERVMRPTYGVPLTRVLFEPDDSVVQNDIKARMEEALRIWVPGATIIGIRAESMTPEDGLVQFLISFMLPGSADHHSALINVGGTVTESTITI